MWVFPWAHTPDAQMFSYTCWHLSHCQEESYTHFAERKANKGGRGQEEIKKQRQSFAKKERRGGKSEKQIKGGGTVEKGTDEENKREGKKVHLSLRMALPHTWKQFWCMWVERAATHALLIPASAGLLLSLSCLAAHSSLRAKISSLAAACLIISDSM